MGTINVFSEESDFVLSEERDILVVSAMNENEEGSEGEEEGFEENDEAEDEIAPFVNSVFDAPEDPLAS